MESYVALLRAINVGGNNKVGMADLREMLGDMGFENAKTLLQSGNAVFQCAKRSETALEAELESATKDRFVVDIDYVVRSSRDVDQVIAKNPFPDAAKTDPSHLVVMFFKSAPSRETLEGVRGAIKGREEIELIGREAFITYPDSIGTSKFTGNVIEKKFGVRGTARNWNTVLKLRDLVSATEA
jgi:uncharacterized protein (DUF1697 family)